MGELCLDNVGNERKEEERKKKGKVRNGSRQEGKREGSLVIKVE